MSFHEYRINELYSSADGKIQFIEMSVGGYDGESFWRGVSLISSSNGVTNTYHFPSNLPSVATAVATLMLLHFVNRLHRCSQHKFTSNLVKPPERISMPSMLRGWFSKRLPAQGIKVASSHLATRLMCNFSHCSPPIR